MLDVRAGKTVPAADEIRWRHTQRMYDLGMFMKALKQQFTRWYNKREGRKGTLWEARYKSVVIEGDARTDAGHSMLMTVAAYIRMIRVRCRM